jgi:hypothetical protein
MAGDPDEVLTLLTEPDSIARWSPIEFDVVDYCGERLRPGDRVRVAGRLAGRSLAFDVDVAQADSGHLALTATGPIRLDVDYHAIATAGRGSDVRAKVTVSGKGLLGRVLAQATDALLASGALAMAVGRIAREFEPSFEPALAA